MSFWTDFGPWIGIVLIFEVWEVLIILIYLDIQAQLFLLLHAC